MENNIIQEGCKYLIKLKNPKQNENKFKFAKFNGEYWLDWNQEYDESWMSNDIIVITLIYKNNIDNE